MTAIDNIPTRPPHELAALIAALVGLAGSTGLLARMDLTADQLAEILGYAFAAVALIYSYVSRQEKQP
jgi:hypothetical protein